MTPHGVFPAKFHGECIACGHHISPGEEILRGQIDNVKGWVHVECPAATTDKPTRFQGTTSEEMGF